MEMFWCVVIFAFVTWLLDDYLNIYLVITCTLFCGWITNSYSSLYLIPASIFAIASAIAGNGKRQVEFEKKKLTSNESGK